MFDMNFFTLLLLYVYVGWGDFSGVILIAVRSFMVGSSHWSLPHCVMAMITRLPIRSAMYVT